MVRRLVNEIALQEYKMDPFVGMSLFANVTKLCVVMHYLQQHKNQLGEKDQPGTSYMKLIGTHEFDDCSDNLVVPQHQKPKLIDNDSERQHPDSVKLHLRLVRKKHKCPSHQRDDAGQGI